VTVGDDLKIILLQDAVDWMHGWRRGAAGGRSMQRGLGCDDHGYFWHRWQGRDGAGNRMPAPGMARTVVLLSA